MPGDSFKAFVLDQLAPLPSLRARAMFGGHGLYADTKFFGILFDNRLYLKVSPHTQTAYEARGMGPFTYEMPTRTITMSYYEVPADILEDRNELLQWARASVAVAEKKAQSISPRRRKDRNRTIPRPNRKSPPQISGRGE